MNKTQDPLKAPVVDLDRIRETYAELKSMEVKLDPNPIEYGPQRFNNRIAAVRAMLNRIDQIFLQVSEDLHLYKRMINAKRTLYDFDKRELLVNDTRVRVGRSQAEREALADVQLRSSLEEMVALEQAAQDLEILMVSIKSKRTDLKDAQGRMRDQMKLIEHDLGMGARWGNVLPPTVVTEDIDTLLVDIGNLEEEEEEEEEDDEETLGTEEEPVLVLGEDGDLDSSEEEDLVGDNTADEVDSFFAAMDSTVADSPADSEEEDEVSGIDDLIAILADED